MKQVLVKKLKIKEKRLSWQVNGARTCFLRSMVRELDAEWRDGCLVFFKGWKETTFKNKMKIDNAAIF
jgi:hypothetical protein